MKRNSKGVTLISLVIMIIVLGILASIVVTFGTQAINNANIQNLKTNMLLIEAKAKEYVENANYDLGIHPEEATEEMKNKSISELKGTKVEQSDSIVSILQNIGINTEDIENGNVYKLSTEDLAAIGINNTNSNDRTGWYIIVYNIPEDTAKIYHTQGIRINDTETKYSLEDINQIELK